MKDLEGMMNRVNALLKVITMMENTITLMDILSKSSDEEWKDRCIEMKGYVQGIKSQLNKKKIKEFIRGEL